jgi:putative ABC transport system ATP-binding protein
MELAIRNLSKNFTQGDREVPALKNVNLTVSEGEFISIIGRSGSGKSTLLNIVSGLLEPSDGEILYDGQNISELSDEELSYIRNSKVGYIMQGKSLLSGLSVIDNVLLPFYLFKRDGDATLRARKLLKQMGILHLENAYPSKLSGGELRRVAIARALITSPEILLADEPTSDLDMDNTEEIMKLLREASDGGTTVIMVTHELDTLKYGEGVYVMEEGILSKKEAPKYSFNAP